jgi:hypothetical protein
MNDSLVVRMGASEDVSDRKFESIAGDAVNCQHDLLKTHCSNDRTAIIASSEQHEKRNVSEQLEIECHFFGDLFMSLDCDYTFDDDAVDDDCVVFFKTMNLEFKNNGYLKFQNFSLLINSAI